MPFFPSIIKIPTEFFKNAGAENDRIYVELLRNRKDTGRNFHAVLANFSFSDHRIARAKSKMGNRSLGRKTAVRSLSPCIYRAPIRGNA